MKNKYAKILFAAAIVSSFPTLVHAQSYTSYSGTVIYVESEPDENLIGKWRSETIHENDEVSTVIYLKFTESGEMTIDFDSEYYLPEIGTATTSVSAVGRFRCASNTFEPDMDERVKTEMSDIEVRTRQLKDTSPYLIDNLHARMNNDMHMKMDFIFQEMDYHNLKYEFTDEDNMIVYLPYGYMTEIKFRRIF